MMVLHNAETKRLKVPFLVCEELHDIHYKLSISKIGRSAMRSNDTVL
jgi:hypothetical protein